MINKIFTKLILIIFLLLIIFISVLSIIGIETDRFNALISEKVDNSKNIKLELKTINFKLDLKALSLFLETDQPKINYKDLSIPTQNIKVYVDFLSLLKTDLKIKKINLVLNELDISQLNKISQFLKPSNFKSILNNKINDGKLISEIEIFLDNEGALTDYIIKGDVINLEANILDDFKLIETNFSFFADSEDILIKNIFGNIENIKINDGDIRLNLEKGVKLFSNFNTAIDLKENNLGKYLKLIKKNDITRGVKSISGNFKNNVSVDFDETYKLINFNYKLSGKVEKSKIELSNPFKINFINETIKDLHLINTQIQADISPKNFKFNGKGDYSFNGLDFLKFNLDNKVNNESVNLDLNFDFKNYLNIKLINYEKPKNSVANLSINLEKEKKFINIKKFNFKEKDNYITISGLKLKDNSFDALETAEVQTKNNRFVVQFNKKIQIKGSSFDATNLPKILNNQVSSNKFSGINKDVEINLTNIKFPLSEKLKNFRLIGKIQKGKFVKISSKGDFGANNFLDISMKKDKNTDKRFLEIYSDLTEPLLTEYNFFKGLSGGKLLFTSLIDGSKTNSKLKIENFKVVNAPALIKLLSLADLGGLADLAEGDGLSFDLLEIDMEKSINFTKLNEILALGPSISVLMEGYIDENEVTSLRGTLVPAKTLNKMISKIPVIGNIVIPKQAGEGLFGISFKMKGPKGKIKTTINPIRTLTPRFIQKIIDKNNNSK